MASDYQATRDLLADAEVVIAAGKVSYTRLGMDAVGSIMLIADMRRGIVPPLKHRQRLRMRVDQLSAS